MVQFARRTDGTGASLHALKFFAKRKDYDEEVAIYADAPVQLKRFMPAVNKYVDNLDGSVKDPWGNHVPPFIIMEKGESLSDRAQYMPVDLFTAAQVGAPSAACLYIMVHAASVHAVHVWHLIVFWMADCASHLYSCAVLCENGTHVQRVDRC